jgi:hypothetical protein
MTGRVADINILTVTWLAVHSPDSLDTLGLVERFRDGTIHCRPVTMKALIRKYRRVH